METIAVGEVHVPSGLPLPSEHTAASRRAKPQVPQRHVQECSNRYVIMLSFCVLFPQVRSVHLCSPKAVVSVLAPHWHPQDLAHGLDLCRASPSPTRSQHSEPQSCPGGPHSRSKPLQLKPASLLLTFTKSTGPCYPLDKVTRSQLFCGNEAGVPFLRLA